MPTQISLPRGVSDFLPETATKIGYIESKIRKVFESYGFQRVIPPKLEYEDVLAIGMGDGLKGKTYRFDDRQSGRLLAFPPDITPQIARIVATRMSTLPLPYRISYSGRVLRQTEMQAGRSREILQSGVELIGLDSPEADAELVVMAVEVLQQLGFDSFKIDLGQVEFCRGIMAASGLNGSPLQELMHAVSFKDSSAVATILSKNNVTKESHREISALPRLFGGTEVLAEASSIINNERSKAALHNLCQVLEILEMHGVGKFLTVDLGETRGLDYHTGLTFEGFVSGLGEAVCSGGRYDSLTGRYGFPAPATGFTFNVLHLLQALQRYPEVEASATRDFLLFNSSDNRKRALDIARNLRQNGYLVARDIIRRDYCDSFEYARTMNFRYILIVEDTEELAVCKVVRTSDRKELSLNIEQLQQQNLIVFIEKSLGEQ